MGFLRDLFGPAQPCDVCQLGKGSWPKEHNGIADPIRYREREFVSP